MKDNEVFIKTGCLSSEALEGARNNKLSDEQWNLFDNHLSECDICSDAYDGVLISDKFIDITTEIRSEISGKLDKIYLRRWQRSVKYISVAASIILLFGLYYFSMMQNQNQSNGIVESIVEPLDDTLYRPTPQLVEYSYVGECEKLKQYKGAKIFSPGTVESTSFFTNQIFTYSEEMPEFPGGITELDEFIKNEVSKAEKEHSIRSCGKVIVEFMINEKGEIENPTVVSGGSKKLNRIAVSIIKKLPNWKPGYQSGEAVNVAFSLPVKFENC